MQDLSRGMTWSGLSHNRITQVAVLTIVCREERWKHENMLEDDYSNSDDTEY